MTERQVIDFCLKHEISVEQYFIAYLIEQRWKGDSDQFIKYVGRFPWSTLDKVELRSKGIIGTNRGHNLDPENLNLTPEYRETLDQIRGDFGKELYEAYPVMFPLGDGKSFVARTGISPDQLSKVYSEKINNDPEKHVYVMTQLAKYIDLVGRKKINGHKLVDWVTNEMWDTVAKMEDTTDSFAVDIN